MPMPGVTTTFVYGRCALGGTSRLPVFPRYDDLRSEMRGTASGPLRSMPESQPLFPEAPQPGKKSPYLVGGLGVLCTEAVGSVNGHK
jgi:hypothetical protein